MALEVTHFLVSEELKDYIKLHHILLITRHENLAHQAATNSRSQFGSGLIATHGNAKSTVLP